MIFKRKENSGILEIKQELCDINKKLKEEFERRDKWENQKEKWLTETLEQKSKLEVDKNKLLEEKIILKDTIDVKEKLIVDLENESNSQKSKIKDLLEQIKDLFKYKAENESLKKENKILEKELEKLKEEGITLPKKVRKTGPTKETKQEMGIRRGAVEKSVKAILKEKNEVQNEKVN